MPVLILLNKPSYLLAQVVDFLTQGWAGGLLDLSEMMIVLPTQESRRRLHEALVRKAASREAALLSPVWMLPMQLPEGMKNLEGERSDLVPASLEQILWIEVIGGMTREESQCLFPRKTPQLDPPRAAELANSIGKLRGELSQVGMTLRDARAVRSEDARWKALVSLEDRYFKRVAQEGFIDRITAQIEGAKHPKLPAQIKHLMIAGIPDLPKVYDAMIPRIEDQGIKVDILAYDPLRFGGKFFDSLGRPGNEWGETSIPIEKGVIHLCLDRAEEAEKAALLIKASGGSGRTCAVGVTITELAKPIFDALKAHGISAFNPAGQPLDTLPIGRLLRLLSDQLREEDFRSSLQLLRHPHIQSWLAFDPLRDLESLDSLANHLIPSSLDDLLERWPEEQLSRIKTSETLRESLLSLSLLISELKVGLGTTPILHALRTIYSLVDLAQIAGGRESIERMRAWLHGGEEHMKTMDSRDLLTLLISHLQSGICTGEKKPDSVELPGWLELLWEDAPHLIVSGMNDGLVPEVRQEDPFLHEKLRVAWGLASDASRLRRDSYLLLSMMATRAESQGRIDLLLARQDDEGSVLKPSRLLLRCADDADLPALVQELFRELPPRPNEKWRSAWALKPDHRTSPRTLSASALRDYLDCPTRFYLKHILKLRVEQFGAEEVDAATFGTLLHTTLRDFGNDPKLRDLREEKQIERALVQLWKQLFDNRYGNHPSFPLIYQREAAIRRLRGVARAQARLREEGWEIIACERAFDAFPVSGMKLRGQIDRIDWRTTPAGIEWRIIDYKSSETKKDPAKEHYRPLGKRDHSEILAPYECFEQNEKIHRWIDLQLPLYRMVLLSEIASGHSTYLQLDQIMTGSVEIGYFIIPAKVNETEFLSFAEIEQYEESALACLEGVLGAIQKGIFWPPRKAKYDNFEGLLFNHLEADSASGQQTLDPVNLIPHSAEEVMS